MALPKNYSIWLAVDYNGIEKAFWNKPKRCEKHREWWDYMFLSMNDTRCTLSVPL